MRCVSTHGPSDDPVCDPVPSSSEAAVTVALSGMSPALTLLGSDRRPCVGLGCGVERRLTMYLSSYKSSQKSSSSLVSPQAVGRRGRAVPLSLSRLAPRKILEEWSGES